MDNTAALSDVIDGLIKDPEVNLTLHGLAVEAGIPWATFDRRVIDRPNKPSEPGALRLDQVGRIAAVLGMKTSQLLALAEEREAHASSSNAA